MNTIRDEIRVRLAAQGKSKKQIDAMFEAYSAIDRLGSKIDAERRQANKGVM